MAALTAEQYSDIPNDHTELVDGIVVAMSPAKPDHGLICGRFCVSLGAHVQATAAGELLTADPGFVTRRNPDRVRAPDVAFVSRRRMVGRDLHRFFEGSPDIAVEVISESESARSVAAKVEEYLAAGTLLVWAANPRKDTLTVHRQDRTTTILRPGDTLTGEDVLPGFAESVAWLLGGSR